MNQRLTSLSFIIGLFFLLVALILLIGYFVSEWLADTINLYVGIIFLLFGLCMTLIPSQRDSAD